MGHHPKNLSTVITDFVHQVIVQQTFAALSLFCLFASMRCSPQRGTIALCQSPTLISWLPFAHGFITEKTRYLIIIWAGENQLCLMGYLSRVKITLLIIDIHVIVSNKDDKEYI